LWIAAVETLWGEVDAFFAANWPRRLSPSRALLDAVFELFVDASVRWPAYVRIPFIEGATPSWRTEWLVDRHFRQHVTTADRILRAMQRKGELGPGDTAHYQVMMSSSISVLITQSAMWNRAFDRTFDEAAGLKKLVRLSLDKLLAASFSDHLVK
jgi:hypothetical protein